MRYWDVMSGHFLRAVCACALLAVIAGCGDPAAPSDIVPFSQVDLRIGNGTEATAGKLVTVNYTGWLFDSTKTDQKGIQFETTAGATPFSFQLGQGLVIAGWEQGIPGMKVGGLRRLVIPPSLAYGSSRNGPIPPNTPLVFEVEMMEVADPAQGASR
jgi:FKBP-type peptidyl-prolyl cis-trans isomerase FkpA